MINFTFNIRNPLVSPCNKIINDKSCKVSKNKSANFEYGIQRDLIVGVSFDLTFNCDHAGIHIYFGILGFYFNFELIDTRHWNYKENRWYLPDEEDMEWIENVSEFDKETK